MPDGGTVRSCGQHAEGWEYTRKPVGASSGWHVIRVNSTRKLEKPSLEETWDTLRIQVLQESHVHCLRSQYAAAGTWHDLLSSNEGNTLP